MIPTLLIKAARIAVDRLTQDKERLGVQDLDCFPAQARENQAVFVSLWRWPSGDPRASHGFHHPSYPLIKAVLLAAQGCAVHETIFPRLKPKELADIVIRVHLLGQSKVIELASSPRTLPGESALKLSYSDHSAFFLPESMILAGWDLPEAASQLCLKAGLPGNMWRDPALTLHLIPVTCYGEATPYGPVVAISAA